MSSFFCSSSQSTFSESELELVPRRFLPGLASWAPAAAVLAWPSSWNRFGRRFAAEGSGSKISDSLSSSSSSSTWSLLLPSSSSSSSSSASSCNVSAVESLRRCGGSGLLRVEMVLGGRAVFRCSDGGSESRTVTRESWSLVLLMLAAARWAIGGEFVGGPAPSRRGDCAAGSAPDACWCCVLSPPSRSASIPKPRPPDPATPVRAQDRLQSRW